MCMFVSIAILLLGIEIYFIEIRMFTQVSTRYLLKSYDRKIGNIDIPMNS